MSLEELYGSDDTEIEAGAWIILRPKTGATPAMRVKLRSVHSKAYRRENQKLDKKYRVQYIAGDGVLDPEVQDEKDVILISRVLLLGWEGFTGADDKPLDFTPKVVQDTLRAYPQLRRELVALARMDENFRGKEKADAERKAIVGN